MADKKISQLTGATTPLAGTEVLPIVQSGSTVKVSAANITAGRAVSMSTLAVGTATPSTGYTADVRGDFVAGNGDSSYSCNVGSDANYGYIRHKGSANGLLLGTQDNRPVFMIINSSIVGKFDTAGNYAPNAAKGIDFSANTGAAGETGALLNWYEEGTWTPTITPSTSGAVTYTTQDGKYTRIGNLVVINFALAGSKNTASGEFRIGGLPFSMVSTGGITGAINWYQPGGTALVNATAFYFSATAFRIGTLTAADVDATAGSYGSSLISTTFSLTGSLFYFVS